MARLEKMHVFTHAHKQDSWRQIQFFTHFESWDTAVDCGVVMD